MRVLVALSMVAFAVVGHAEEHCQLISTSEGQYTEGNQIRSKIIWVAEFQSESEIGLCLNNIQPTLNQACQGPNGIVEFELVSVEAGWKNKPITVSGKCYVSNETAFANGQFVKRRKFPEIPFNIKGVSLDAAKEGTVLINRFDPDLGRMLIVNNTDGTQTRYLGLNQAFVGQNDKVKDGDTIATFTTARPMPDDGRGKFKIDLVKNNEVILRMLIGK